MLTFDEFEVLTFDCYGTLIDWEAGIAEALQPVLTNHRVKIPGDAALELFAVLESEAEHGAYVEYRTVLRRVLEGFGARLEFTPTPSELQDFGESVKDWLPFPDSARALRALHGKYRLAVVSNIDDDLFAVSAARLGTTFDWVITAQQARSYKPAANNFRMALERIGLPRNRVLHVAQSLHHDIVPAQALGLSTVWVNRRQHRAGSGATLPAQAQADLEVPDLQTLVRVMGLA